MIPLLFALLISTHAADGGAAVASPTPVARPQVLYRLPVLTQGVELVNAPCFAGHSVVEPGMLIVILDEHLRGHARRILPLLPSTVTDELRTMLARNDPETPWRFEVSGTVYDYGGRAFLLPSAIIALRSPPPPPMLARVPPTPEPVGEELAEPEESPTPLLRAVPSATYAPLVLRRPQEWMAHESTLAAVAPAGDDFGDELERRLAAGTRAAAAGSVLPEELPQVEQTVAAEEGTRLQDRRATISRDPITGVWRAMLATSTGQDGQDGMELLPCRMLQQMERTVKQSPVGAPWLVSGQIVTAGERRYLMLSAARLMPAHRWMSR